MKSILGQKIEVVIERPLGSSHPEYPDCIYSVNYGFVPGVYAADGEEQDAYVLGVTKQISRFYGRVVAVIHRLDDNEDKWVAAPEEMLFTEAEIRSATWFVVQYFASEIEVYNG